MDENYAPTQCLETPERLQLHDFLHSSSTLTNASYLTKRVALIVGAFTSGQHV